MSDVHRYAEAIRILSLVPKGGTLLDLGAGTGRMLLTAALMRPDVRCVGMEVVAERVRLARQALRSLGAERSCVLQRSLGNSALPLPVSDVVYLFNPFSPATLAAVFWSLTQLANSCAFLLVLKAMDHAVLECASSAWLFLRQCMRPVSCRAVGLPASGFLAWRVQQVSPTQSACPRARRSHLTGVDPVAKARN